MNAIDWLLIFIFVPPILLLSALFLHEGNRMMRIEASRAEIRRQARRARCYDAAQRKVRGTPSKRPGALVIR